MKASRNFLHLRYHEDSMTKLYELAAVLFTPEEIAAIDALTENVDAKFKNSYRYDVMVWAMETRNAENKGVKILHGIFKGIIHLAEVYPNGGPHFLVEHGREGEL